MCKVDWKRERIKVERHPGRLLKQIRWQVMRTWTMGVAVGLERKGWIQGFKFPPVAPHKSPKSFYVYLKRDPYLLQTQSKPDTESLQLAAELQCKLNFQLYSVLKSRHWLGRNGVLKIQMGCVAGSWWSWGHWVFFTSTTSPYSSTWGE